MVAAYITDIPRSSHDTTYIIDFVRKLDTKSTTFFSHIKIALLALITIPTVIVVSIPFLLILLLVFKLSKFRLKNSLRKDVKISLSNYKEVKYIQLSLEKDLLSIQQTIDTLNGKSIFISSVFINDIKNTYTVLSDFQQRLSNSLTDLSRSDKNGKYFSLISEETLWSNRVEAYQYRL
ncbi:MAG: hypothetical protein H7339_14910 [Arcicella sp.]|nr:hypothetical protein [Arcicella sp.]